MTGLLVAAIVVIALAAWMLRSPGTEPTLQLGQRSQVARDTALEIDPALSPNGQFLAYASGNLGGDFKVFVRQISGGTPIPVAPDLPGVQRFPAWTPDGGQITFRSTRGLEIVPATGGVSRRFGARPVFERATWNPDGTEIAWVAPAPGGDGDGENSLWVQPPDGDESSGRELLTGRPVHSLSWSPDGDWIAFVEGNTTGVDTLGNIAPSEIWVVPAAGGEPTQVTRSGGFNASPAWLGSTLLFVSDRDGGRDVYAVDLDADGRAQDSPRALTTGVNTLAISVAADVDRLVYSVFLDRSNVWSLPIPTTAPASSLDATPVTTGSQIVELFSVSHDGQWLAFDSDRQRNQDIFRQPLAGGSVEALTTDPADDFAPAWSLDDAEIAFYSYRDSPRQLLIMPSDGGTETLVADGQFGAPAWSPDGTTIASRLRPADDLVLIRRTNGRWGAPETILAGAAKGSYMDWSPDNQHITFTSVQGLEVVSIDSGARTVLLPLGSDPYGQFYPQWSEDGRWIYFLSTDFSGIYAIAPTGGDTHLVVRFDPARPWHRYGFQATADRLYFTLGEVESDLWVADIGR